MPKMRGVIYTRTVVVEDNPRAFHKAMSDVIEELEQVGQQYGCCESVVSENDEIPDMSYFTKLPLEYIPL